MSQKNSRLFLTFTVFGILMFACSFSSFAHTPTEIPGLAATSVAATLGAQMTDIALRPTNTVVPPSPTATLPPPTATNIPTSTPLPTATKTTAPTATPIPCNRAAFITDVTVSDGSLFTPNSQFSKVWRLKNNGRCAWTAKYELVYFSGDKMNGASVTKFNTRVEPGESIDVGVVLTAPASSGEYLGYWMLRTVDGDMFGIGAQGDKPFWVNIEVIDSGTSFVYDFAEKFCEAKWQDKNSPLPCQGAVGTEENIIRLSDSIVMETGTTEDELGLWINVGKLNQVSGTYPALIIQAGDRFVTQIGCFYDSTACHARFKLSYKEVGVDTLIELGSWVEKYDNSSQIIDLDLSSLAGKNVKLILSVTSLTNSGPIEVFWFVPRVQNP